MAESELISWALEDTLMNEPKAYLRQQQVCIPSSSKWLANYPSSNIPKRKLAQSFQANAKIFRAKVGLYTASV